MHYTRYMRASGSHGDALLEAPRVVDLAAEHCIHVCMLPNLLSLSLFMNLSYIYIYICICIIYIYIYTYILYQYTFNNYCLPFCIHQFMYGRPRGRARMGRWLPSCCMYTGLLTTLIDIMFSVVVVVLIIVIIMFIVIISCKVLLRLLSLIYFANTSISTRLLLRRSVFSQAPACHVAHFFGALYIKLHISSALKLPISSAVCTSTKEASALHGQSTN